MLTGERTERREIILLDACVAINLFATRRMEEIVDALPEAVGFVDLVRGEALHVRRGGGGDDADERDPLDLTPLLDAGILHLTTPTERELDAFAEFTLQLDDGEAMTAAVAVSRGWMVATDDRKAVRVLATRVAIRSTLDLLKTWADQGSVGDETIRAALWNVRERGRYRPRRDHPLRDWWHAFVPED